MVDESKGWVRAKSSWMQRMGEEHGAAGTSPCAGATMHSYSNSWNVSAWAVRPSTSKARRGWVGIWVSVCCKCTSWVVLTAISDHFQGALMVCTSGAGTALRVSTSEPGGRAAT